MKREIRFQNTDYFTFYNANPKNRYTTDCVVRAICTALCQPYNDTLRELVEFQCSTGFSLNDPRGYDKFLQNKGWVKCKQPRKADNTKYTGYEFCRENRDITCVANIGGSHTVAIVEGKIQDIWDSSYGSIGNYWIKA